MTRRKIIAVLIGVLLASVTMTPRAAADRADDGARLVRQGDGVAHDLYVSDVPSPRMRPDGAQTAAVFPRGFAPPHIQGYLGLEGDGEGETIAIVTAYHYPSLVGDLIEFSATFGLPLVCGAEFADPQACIDVNVIGSPGTPVDEAWALETALDVQWAHVVAPLADIVVVEAADDELHTMMRAVQTASRSGATVISGSWGEEEQLAHHRYDHHCSSKVICVFATGNTGQPAAYPSVIRHAIAVGGTSFRLDIEGNVLSEDGWSGSGGGVSKWRARPKYQRDISPYRRRATPDVSYHADPLRSYLVYDSLGYEGQTGWFAIGGTSAAAPQWAGIIAVANQLRVEEGKPRLSASRLKTHLALYALHDSPVLYDVTTGVNGTCGAACTAGEGYDLVSGLGSPRRGIDTALAATP
jgi:subtilisin family serine protease